MKTNTASLIIGLISLVVVPISAHGDQNDSRLVALFTTLQANDSQQAASEAEQAIWKIWFESGVDEIDTLMEQASQAMEASELAIAEALYSRVIELRPDFSEGWNRRATVRYYQSDFEGSLNDIERTLALEPRHFGAMWGLGMILGARENFAEAIAAFERLLEIKPNARDAQPRIALLKKAMARQAI